MKKSIIISSLTLASILALTGCGNSGNESAAINNLSHQLDRVTNTVSAISNGNDKKYDLQEMALNDETYQDLYQKQTNIQSNKSQVLSKIKSIKKKLVDGVKLGSAGASAISELTTAMQRNTNNLNKTKSDFNRSITNISNNKSNSGLLDAHITRLACCMTARECYLKNILYALEGIENALNNNQEDSAAQEQTSQMQENVNQELPQNVTQPAQQPQQPINMLPQYPSNGVNGAYGYGYNGLGNGYGYGFNPSRNTDTYGPGVTNIDSYRFNSNPNNPYNHMYGQRPMLEQDCNDCQEPNQMQQENVKFENHQQQRESTDIPAQKPPLPALTREQETGTPNQDDEIKIKSVCVEQKHLDDEPTEQLEKPAEQEELQGADKAKGHTKTLASILLDVNKKIEKLIKG